MNDAARITNQFETFVSGRYPGVRRSSVPAPWDSVWRRRRHWRAGSPV